MKLIFLTFILTMLNLKLIAQDRFFYPKNLYVKYDTSQVDYPAKNKEFLILGYDEDSVIVFTSFIQSNGLKIRDSYQFDQMDLLIVYNIDTQLPLKVSIKGIFDTIGDTYEFYPSLKLRSYHKGFGNAPIEGDLIQYFENGTISSKAQYSKGQIVNSDIHYNPDQSIQSIAFDSPFSKLHYNSIQYDESGRVQFIREVLKDSTIEDSFFKEGLLFKKVFMKHTDPNMLEDPFFIKALSVFKVIEYEKNGDYLISYYDDGILVRKEQYKDGKLKH